jgi:hypothetical protein
VFDLTLLPFHYIEDREQPELPGFIATNAPRRAARGRDGEQLILLVVLSGSAAFPDGYPKLLNRLVDTYFNTPGSITSAIRVVAESLNQTFLDRNLRASANAGQCSASLNLVVIHGKQALFGHGGPAHSLVLTSNIVEHYFDPQAGTKGLGFSRTIPLRYYQTEINPGDYLILSPDPSPEWTPAALTGASGLSEETLARKLLSTKPASLAAGLIHLQAGNGKINIQRAPSIPMPMRATPTELPTIQEEKPPSRPVQPVAEPAEALEELVVESTEARIEESPRILPEPATPIQAPQVEPSLETPQPAGVEEAPEEPIRRSTAPRPASRPKPIESLPKKTKKRFNLRPFAARLWHGSRSIQKSSSQASRSFLGSLLPGQAGQVASLSPGTMAFIAIAIPIVVVTLATMVYFQRGRSQVYQEYMSQAQAEASRAAAQSDPAALRSAWSATLLWLDKAEAYQTTDVSQQLRQTAQSALDNLDGITRLAYQPAIIGGLASTVQITRMVATSGDLYMLDVANGKVIRAILTGRGYEVDPAFRCEKGTFGATKVGDLLDIAPIPKGNEFKATVLALDGSGNLLYCIPDQAPLSAPLAPPDTGWGSIKAFTYDSGNLYVLDPQQNALWMYAGGGGTFSNRPNPFFEQEPPAMGDGIDLAVNNTDLYLLHADGHLTMCTLSYITTSPTRCIDPATMSDTRPGKEASGATLPDTLFNHILFTQPPDPSLYFLEAKQAAIYHFSLRLNLQRALKPQTSTQVPRSPATAYTIGPNHTAYLAFGNQVFYALLP